MNQETPTPRTEDTRQFDAVIGQWTVTADFARQLERELSATNSEKELYKAAYIRASEACAFIQHEAEELGLRLGQETTSDGVTALKAQRDKLRSELQTLRNALNGPPSYMSCDKRMIPINSTGMRQLIDELSAANAAKVAAEATCAELVTDSNAISLAESLRKMEERAERAEQETNEISDTLRAAMIELRAELAAKDAALREVVYLLRTGATKEQLNLRLIAALSLKAGNGWLSPREAKKLREEITTLLIIIDAHKGMARLLREQRNEWRKNAENLAQFISVENNPAGQAALTAHDALVAK